MGEDNYKTFVTWITVVSLIIFLFSGILLLDDYLPLTRANDKIIKSIFYTTSSGRPGGGSYQMGIVTSTGRIPITSSLFEDITDGDSIGIDRTVFLHFARSFHYKGSDYLNGNVYSFHKIPLYILFVLSSLSLLMRKLKTQVLIHFVSISVIIFIILFILFVNDIYIAAS